MDRRITHYLGMGVDHSDIGSRRSNRLLAYPFVTEDSDVTRQMYFRPFIGFIVVLIAVSCSKKQEIAPQGQTASNSLSIEEEIAFKDCPPEGLGGGNARLNRFKNRDHEPAHYEQTTIEHLIALRPQHIVQAGKHDRNAWAADATAEAAEYEKKGVSVEAYLLGAKQSGIESCNCKREDLRDWHVWIGPHKPASSDEAKSMRGEGMVVEPTPRWQERKGWRLRQLTSLARQGAKVRVSGWLLWDQEHPEELPEHKGDKATRGTLWEIHPITKIEVYTGGRWVEFTNGEIVL